MGFFSGMYNRAKETLGNIYDFGKQHIGKIALGGLALATPYIAPKLFDNLLHRTTGIRWDESVPQADKATAGRLYGSSYRMFQ